MHAIPWAFAMQVTRGRTTITTAVLTVLLAHHSPSPDPYYCQAYWISSLLCYPLFPSLPAKRFLTKTYIGLIKLYFNRKPPTKTVDDIFTRGRAVSRGKQFTSHEATRQPLTRTLSSDPRVSRCSTYCLQSRPDTDTQTHSAP